MSITEDEAKQIYSNYSTRDDRSRDENDERFLHLTMEIFRMYFNFLSVVGTLSLGLAVLTATIYSDSLQTNIQNLNKDFVLVACFFFVANLIVIITFIKSNLERTANKAKSDHLLTRFVDLKRALVLHKFFVDHRDPKKMIDERAKALQLMKEEATKIDKRINYQLDYIWAILIGGILIFFTAFVKEQYYHLFFSFGLVFILYILSKSRDEARASTKKSTEYQKEINKLYDSFE